MPKRTKTEIAQAYGRARVAKIMCKLKLERLKKEAKEAGVWDDIKHASKYHDFEAEAEDAMKKLQKVEDMKASNDIAGLVKMLEDEMNNALKRSEDKPRNLNVFGGEVV